MQTDIKGLTGFAMSQSQNNFMIFLNEAAVVNQPTNVILPTFPNELFDLVPLAFTGVLSLLCISYHPVMVLLRCAPILFITSRLIIKLNI